MRKRHRPLLRKEGHNLGLRHRIAPPTVLAVGHKVTMSMQVWPWHSASEPITIFDRAHFPKTPRQSFPAPSFPGNHYSLRLSFTCLRSFCHSSGVQLLSGRSGIPKI
jgi:hypothetical protein